jgi:hypothetical protein
VLNWYRLTFDFEHEFADGVLFCVKSRLVLNLRRVQKVEDLHCLLPMWH